MPRADMPSPSGSGSVSRRTALTTRLVVGQRLAHAHEDHVGQAAGATGHLTTRQRAGAGDDLLDDLGGGHVAGQAVLAGGAERAGHAAAGLAGDADRDPVGVAHQHRLDEGAVEEPPHRLAGGALVGLERAQRRHQLGQERGDDVVALSHGQVGHRGRVVDQPREVVRGELLGPEAPAAPARRPPPCARRQRGRPGDAAAFGGHAARRTRGKGLGWSTWASSPILPCDSAPRHPPWLQWGPQRMTS